MTGLTNAEMINLHERIGREPNETEQSIVAAEWSEHCSYKSSKKHLSLLPRSGGRLITDSTYDSGVIDVGDGYVVTVHIESHNHPSAVEPFGGAATGVGGVIRDILSTGTRPIALLNGLRFGDITQDAHARWLFRNAVSGIAHYGNCIGVPTVGGEIGFDECYSRYAIVDVAAIGFGKRERLIANHAEIGDAVALIGGSTGRDGIGGSQFASDALEGEDRSAVQIPDPFTEKLVIEAILEARDAGLFHALKDLGGGGLSCAISETADSLGVGITLDISQVHTRESGLDAREIMTSESQERMLAIVSQHSVYDLLRICKKYDVVCSVIGRVNNDGNVRVNNSGTQIACMPAHIVANAPLLDRQAHKPSHIDAIARAKRPQPETDHSTSLRTLLGSPNISSREHVYGQYDHEVGIRTVVKPGRDAALLRLDNGKYISLTIDGNPSHCYVDPRHGAAGCFEEACRNTACVGARPVAMIDHLQFGSPEDDEIFWTFKEALQGISDYARDMNIPCAGGKVSFYNEADAGAIKPTPVIGIVGIAERMPPSVCAHNGDVILSVGTTYDEMGGSEYYAMRHALAGACPKVDTGRSKAGIDAVLALHSEGMVTDVHDCSAGGIAVAISEMCIRADTGCSANIDDSPGCVTLPDEAALYSESNSRYLVSVPADDGARALDIMSSHGAVCTQIGRFEGDRITLQSGTRDTVSLGLDDAATTWRKSLARASLG